MLTQLKDKHDVLHVSDLYDRYFYEPSFIEQLLRAFGRFTPEGKTDLTFIEFFSGIGYIGQQVLNALPAYQQAHLYDFSKMVVEKGRLTFPNPQMNFFQADLSQPLPDIQQRNGMLYIGAQSYQYFLTRAHMSALAANCAAQLMPGSTIIFYMVPISAWEETLRNAGSGQFYSEEEGIDQEGKKIRCTYKTHDTDWLRNIAHFDLYLSDGNEELTTPMTMRYWTVADLVDFFEEFTFNMYTFDTLQPIPPLSNIPYNSAFYLVGVRK